MSFACDFILIGIALFILYSGWSKGFIKSVMGLVKGIASAVAAYAYTPMLGNIFYEKWILKPLTNGIFETLRGYALDTKLSVELGRDVYNLDRLSLDLPKELVSILERYNVSVPDFLSGISGMDQVTEDAVYDCSVSIAEPTASLLSSALAFIVIFIGVYLVLSLVTALLDHLFRLPVLNTANKLFGIIFGAAEAFLLVAVMSILLSTLVTSLGSLEPNLFGESVIDHTVICKFFVEHNPLRQIYDVLV